MPHPRTPLQLPLLSQLPILLSHIKVQFKRLGQSTLAHSELDFDYPTGKIKNKRYIRDPQTKTPPNLYRKPPRPRPPQPSAGSTSPTPGEPLQRDGHSIPQRLKRKLTRLADALPWETLRETTQNLNSNAF